MQEIVKCKCPPGSERYENEEDSVNLNIYDTKTVRCVICDKPIEVDYDTELIRPKCRQCSNPIPDTRDKMPYLIYN